MNYDLILGILNIVLIYNFPESIWTKNIPSYFKLNNKEPKIEKESDGFFSSLKSIF